MISTRNSRKNLTIALTCALLFSLFAANTPGAWAGAEDAALFYEDLAKYGEWVDYQKFGPVWRPSGVEENWRPYVDGRWVPTDQGYIFETQEPWGWAVYHFGNWMPTDAYGWVWAPGRTWYPNTVTWRTGDKYVGWAPIPPPGYEPSGGYVPPTGYQPRKPGADQIAPPAYIFASADNFLPGLGQEYDPSYSYMNSASLAPPEYVPVVYPQTAPAPSYVTPTYYPSLLGLGLGVGMGLAAYAWGPPTSYVSAATGIPAVTINRTISGNSVNFGNINNAVPPANVLNQNPAVQQILPPNLPQAIAMPQPQLLPNVPQAAANLANPNVMPLPPQVQPLQAQIPKAPPVAPLKQSQGVVAAALPASAVQPLTPAMQQQIKKLPPKQQVASVQPLLAQPQVKPPAAPAAAAPKPPAPAAAPSPKSPGPPAAAAPKPAAPVPFKAHPPSPGPKLQERQQQLQQQRQQAIDQKKHQLQQQRQEALHQRQGQRQQQMQQKLQQREQQRQEKLQQFRQQHQQRSQEGRQQRQQQLQQKKQQSKQPKQQGLQQRRQQQLQKRQSGQKKPRTGPSGQRPHKQPAAP